MHDSQRSYVYISYGLPKSASTFVYQLTSAVSMQFANRTGRVLLDRLSIDAEDSRGIFAESLMDARGIPRGATGLDAVVAEVESVMASGPPGVAVIKTHSGCSAELAARIATGEILASATFRHPADLMLSRLDMASRDGQDINYNVINGYKNTHVPAFLTWRAVPTVALFEYTDVALHPYSIARHIADQMGLDEDVHDLVDDLISNPELIHQFNKGVVDRRRQELPEDEIAQIESAVPDLMTALAEYQSYYSEPTFAIIVPTMNSALTVDESLLSVIAQRGDFRIRLHVQDGGSTDGTVDRLARWAQLLANDNPFESDRLEFTYANATDAGMYDALQKGFEKVGGEIYAWLGSDDVFLPGAFQTVTSLLHCDPRIDWIVGSHAMSRADGVPFYLANHPDAGTMFPSRRALAAGLADGISAPFLQQEGTFWTDSLWNAVGRSLRSDLRYAGDYELWTRMAQHSEPVAMKYPLGSYRRRPGQLSGDMDAYQREVATVRADLPVSDANAPQPDQTSELRLASLRWPEGTWRIKRITRGSRVPTRSTEPWIANNVDGSTVTQDRSTSSIGWQVLGSDVSIEGPFPELGIEQPFTWMTGSERVLRLRFGDQGDYRVTLLLGNHHRDQVISCSGQGFTVVKRAPNTSAQAKPFTLQFQPPAASTNLDVVLKFARSGSLPDDPRDLAVMLLGVLVEPAQRLRLHRGRRELSPLDVD